MNVIKPSKPSKIPPEIKKLAKKREKARQEKNFKLSDELRFKIETKGFKVQDTSTGQKIIP